MEIKKPLVIVKVDGEDISLYEDKQVAQLLLEKKLSYEALDALGEAFPNIYPDIIKSKLQAQWGKPTTIYGELVKGRDNIDYATVLKFVEAVNYDKHICDMICNMKNTDLRRQIMDIGLPMMCLLTRGK